MEKEFQKIVSTGFIVSQDKVLIVKRSMKEKFFPGVFELPGGKVDFGESAEKALIREIREETNLEIRVFEPFYTFSYISGMQDGSKRHTIELVFRCELNCSREQLRLSKDHDDFRWIGKESLSTKFSSSDQIYKVIKQGFKLYL